MHVQPVAEDESLTTVGWKLSVVLFQWRRSPPRPPPRLSEVHIHFCVIIAVLLISRLTSFCIDLFKSFKLSLRSVYFLLFWRVIRLIAAAAARWHRWCPDTPRTLLTCALVISWRGGFRLILTQTQRKICDTPKSEENFGRGVFVLVGKAKGLRRKYLAINSVIR